MSRLSVVLLSLLVLLSLTFAPSSAQSSSPLHRLRGKLSPSRPIYSLISDPSPAVPLHSDAEAETAIDEQIGVASILPYRTPEELTATDGGLDSALNLEEEKMSEMQETTAKADDDMGHVASIRPYRTEEEVKATEQAAASTEGSDSVWTGEVASILPYRETNTDELREAAEEEEDSEFGVARIVPFDSDTASSGSDADLPAMSDDMPSSGKAVRESEWAKRARVRRYRLKRWLQQKKLGESVIYSH